MYRIRFGGNNNTYYIGLYVYNIIEIRCRGGGGGVLQVVATMMDYRGVRIMIRTVTFSFESPGEFVGKRLAVVVFRFSRTLLRHPRRYIRSKNNYFLTSRRLPQPVAAHHNVL